MSKDMKSTPQKQLVLLRRSSKGNLSKRSDSIEQFKKSHKIVAKSLNADLLAVSEEESSPRDEKESVDFEKEPEDQKLTESPESLVLTPLAASFETSDLSTPLSTIEDALEIGGTVSEFSSSSSKPANLDVRIVTDFLRESRLQISNSSDVDLLSKKILDAMIEVLINDFFGNFRERDRFSGSVSAKVLFGLLCFLIWLVSVWFALFFRSGSSVSFAGPLPT